MARGFVPPKTEAEKYQELVATTAKVVRHAMVDMDIHTMADAAKACGMSKSTFDYKMHNGGWTHKELAKLIRALKIGSEGALALLGV